MPLHASWNGPGTPGHWQLLGSLFSSMVISMLVKSTCKRSYGAVATIRCRDTLDMLSSCCQQCTQDLIDLHLIGHAWPPEMLPQQRQGSHIPDDQSWWHPFKVVTQWALGTMKSRRSSVSPLGIEHRYKAPWWTMMFGQLCRISLPSLLEACSARSAFKSFFFCAFNQFNTALNVGSSFWASA